MQYKVVATGEMAHACGHVGMFEFRDPDPNRARRVEKFCAKRCPECSEKAVKELEARQSLERPHGAPSRAQAVKLLPVGCKVVLMRTAEGWTGTVDAADGVSVTSAGSSLMGVVNKLARAVLRQQGLRRSAKAAE